MMFSIVEGPSMVQVESVQWSGAFQHLTDIMLHLGYKVLQFLG